MNRSGGIDEPQLERKSRRFGRLGLRSFVAGASLGVPGIILVILADTWLFALGLAMVAIALAPAIVATALLLASAVSHWAARATDPLPRPYGGG